MDNITGNFLTQANRDFPLDCETLEYLQDHAALTAVLGNMGGDKIVLSGCASNIDGTRRGEGYVFMRTVAHPEGEVLRWEGGPTAGGMYVKQEAIGVTANNVEYPKAYTLRRLAPGIGSESYRWEDFTDIMSIRELMAENRSLRAEIEGMRPAPLGMVQMWAGAEVPEGYVICNGQQLSVTDYGELYGALGDVFNAAVSANGRPYTTRKGYFRVPDLRGRFVVGQHDSDGDYTSAGAAGGSKKVALTAAEMPAHGHDVEDYVMIPDGISDCTTGTWTVDGKQRKVGVASVSGNEARAQTNYNHKNCIQWVQHESKEAGGGSAHENRPPYYVLAYIMRAR